MPPTTTRITAGLLLGACLVLLAHGLLLGLHFEATPQAVADAAKGEAVGYPAALGAVAALITLVCARHRWSVWPLGAAALLGAAAGVMELTR